MMDEKFYLLLKNFFRERKITQQQIADGLGVSQTYVNALLCGKKNFGRNAAQKFHDAYGLSVAWLLTGDGEMMADGSSSATVIDSAVATGAGSTAVHASGGSTVNASPQADIIASLVETNRRLTEQNQKLIDMLAESYKNRQC